MLKKILFLFIFLPLIVFSQYETPVTGSGIANSIPYWVTSKKLGSAPFSLAATVTTTSRRIAYAANYSGSYDLNTLTAKRYVDSLISAISVGTGTQNYIAKWNNAGGTTIGNSLLSDNGTTLILPSGKYFSSQNTSKTQLSFGTTGNEVFQATTDGGTGLTPYFILRPSTSEFVISDGSGTNFVANTTSLLSLRHAVALSVTSPLFKIITGTPSVGSIFTCTNVDGTGTWSTNSNWSLTGNAVGLNSYFLGTTDNSALLLKTNNTTVAYIDPYSAGLATFYLGSASSVKGSLAFNNTANSARVVINSGLTASTYTLTLPTEQGGTSTLLSNDGAGALSWVATPSTSAGGSNTQLQYNNSGAFGGVTGATTNGTFLTLTTPVLGAASATSINKVAITTPATSATLTIADGKTFTNSNNLTLTATDGSTLAIGTGGTLGTAAYTAASAYEVPLTFSTGLTRTTNTITNNLSVGVSGGQTVIGGTGVGDALTHKSTTGNGTTTSPAHIFVGGNNGATTLTTFLNNGNVGIGSTAPAKLLDMAQSANAGVEAILSNSNAGNAAYSRIGASTNGGSTSIGLVGIGAGFSSSGMLVPNYGALICNMSAGLNIGTNVNTPIDFYTNNTFIARMASGGNVGIGTFTVSARLHVISTTEQKRIGYDASNYYSTTVGSTGGTTFDAVGSGAAFTFNDNVTVALGKSMSVPSGSNTRAGNAVLVGGTVTVSNTTVTANTLVMLTRKTSGGTIGTAITYTLSAGSSFTITSDNILDTSTFTYYLIENP